jgi:colanic acid/amylovoran biosynthesis protein
VTAPVSVGPFQKFFEAKYATWLLKKLDLVLLREDVSREYFKDKKGNLPDNIKRAPDSGFAFSPKGYYDIRSVTGAKKDDLVLAISVRRWMTKSKQDIYEQVHADLLDYIAEKYPNIKPVFIPQCTFAYADDDDREVGKRVLKKSKTKNAILITEALDYKQVKLSYENADLIVGTRFHAMVFGLSYNVPGIAIEYEHKTRGIMRDLGLEKWVINIDIIESKKLIAMFNDLIEERRRYEKHLSKDMKYYAESANNVANIYSKYLLGDK